MGGRVVRISIAPVKALGLIHPESVQLDEHGARGDRRFWLTDRHGRLFNDKRHGALVRIRPEWDEDARVLALTFPDGARVEGVVELGERVEIGMYEHPRPSRRVLGPWEEALSEFAGRRLCFLWAETRAVDRGFRGGGVSFLSRASLEGFRDRAGVDGPVDGRRFRMLFEIDGVDAHEEDEWIGSRVRVGDAEVVVRGDVGRCAVTTHHPDTGVVDLDTLRILNGYRPDGREGAPPFGIYGEVVAPGRVRVGDAVAPT